MKQENKSYEEAKQANIDSGSLKFSTDYVSTKQLYDTVCEWVNSDERVHLASIRIGGSGQHAVDFRYNIKGLPEDSIRGNLKDKVFRPFFERSLGGDYLVGWDHSTPTIIVK
jgi:hypothetical protein